MKCLSKKDLDGDLKFVFISYSHNDKDYVEECIGKLVAKGVNLWYDKDMEGGDNWKQIAGDIIAKPNCVGVIFFSSVKAFFSQACHNERLWTQEKINKNNDFLALSVNIEGMDTNHMLKALYNSERINNSNLNQLIKLEWINLITNIFKSEKIFLRGTKDENVDCIYKACKKYDATNDYDTALEGIPEDCKSSINNGIFLGRYKGLIEDEIPKVFIKDGWFEFDGIKYYGDNKIAYTPERVSWSHLRHDNEYAYYITTKIIDSMPGDESLDRFVNEKIKNALFEENIRGLIEEVRLAKSNEASLAPAITEENKSILFNKMDYWWLAEQDRSPLKRKVAYKDNSIYSYFKKEKAGIRPVIKISIQNLKKIND